MTKRFRDFDAFYAEKQREPVKFKILGEVIILPPGLPASVILRAVRLSSENGKETEVPATEVLAFARDLLGSENLDKLLAKGLDVDQLGDVIKWVISAYTGADLEEAGDPEDPTPTPPLESQ